MKQRGNALNVQTPMPSALRLWGPALAPCGSYSEKTRGLPAFPPGCSGSSYVSPESQVRTGSEGWG